MTKITRFDRANLAVLDAKIKEALAGVARDFGITIEQEGRGRFDANTFTVKYAAKIVGENGVSKRDQEEYVLYSELIGVKSEWFGKVVDIRGTKYRVAGLNMKKKTNTVKLTRVSDSKTFFASPELVKNGFSKISN